MWRIRVLRFKPVTCYIWSNTWLRSLRVALRYCYCALRKYLNRSFMVIGSSLGTVSSVTLSFD